MTPIPAPGKTPSPMERRTQPTRADGTRNEVAPGPPPELLGSRSGPNRWLPEVVVEAADRLGAPGNLAASPDPARTLTGWLDTGALRLHATVPCMPHVLDPHGPHRFEHRIRIDHTLPSPAFTVHPDPTPNQVDRMAAEHTLHALAHPDVPLPCLRTSSHLKDWVGPYARPGLTPEQTTTLAAVRTLIRYREYHAIKEQGLLPDDLARFLPHGPPVTLLLFFANYCTQMGVPADVRAVIAARAYTEVEAGRCRTATTLGDLLQWGVATHAARWS